MKQSKTQQSWLSLCLVFAMVFSMVGGIIPTAFAEDLEAGGTDSEVVKTLESIEITKQPTKKEYTVGDKFDPSGLEIEATFRNAAGEETTETIVYEATKPFIFSMIEGEVSTSITTDTVFNDESDEITLKVGYTYDNSTPSATFTIAVKAATVVPPVEPPVEPPEEPEDDGITSYEISGFSYSRGNQYKIGDSFDFEKYSVSIKDSNGERFTLPLSDDALTVSVSESGPFTETGAHTVTVVYTNPENNIASNSYSFNYYVVDVFMEEDLKFITTPKIEYTVGETTNFDDLVWEATYDDGSTKEFSIDKLDGGTCSIGIHFSDNVSSYNLERYPYTFTTADVGEATIALAYTNVSDEFAYSSYKIIVTGAGEEEPENAYTVYFYEDIDSYKDNINFPYDKETVAEGEFVTPPVLTKTNFAFAGWYHIVADEEGIDREVDWDSSTAITKDIRLIARWDSTLNKVTGRVLTSAGASVEEATVNFRQDGKLIDSTTTIANGYFIYEGLPTGYYHIEAISGYNTRTGYYYVKSGDTEVGDIKLSPYYYTSALNLDSTSPITEVVGFDEMAEDFAENTEYRYDFVLNTYKNTTDEATNLISLYLLSDETLGTVFDIDIKCTETSMANGTTNSNYVSRSPSLLTFTLSLSSAQQGKSEYKIYHANASGVVNAITTEANDDGEYITVSGSKLTLYARNFSTFALVYNNADAETDDDDDEDDDDLYTVALNTLYNGNYTNNSAMGTAFLSTTRPETGDQVFIYTEPSFGYEVSYVKVLDSNGLVAATTTKDGTTYSFYQPSKSVNVLVAFVDQGTAGSSQNYTAFNDVKTSDWFCYATNKVSELGLMYGTGNGNFSPYTTTTRGMIVTILHNMVGRPSAGSNTFSDVAAGSYYEQAVTWANQYNIVGGYTDGTFRPDNNITREELAVMLYQYAKMYQSNGNAFGGNTINFSDNYLISSWAQSAVAWCSTQKIFSGKQGNLFAPNDHSNRAEVAVSLLSLAGYGTY